MVSNPASDVSSPSFTYSQPPPKEGFIQKIRNALGGFNFNKIKLILPILLLIAGVIGSLYLVQQRQQIKSRASLNQIVFKNQNGEELPIGQDNTPQTTSPTVKIHLSSSLGPPPAASSSGGVVAGITAVSLSGSIAGDQSGSPGETFTYGAVARGPNLSWVRIYWMDTRSDPENSAAWKFVAGNENCNGNATCSVEGSFVQNKVGSYYVTAVVADNTFGACSGNPALDGKTNANKDAEPVPGWADCGPNDRTTLTVSGSAPDTIEGEISGNSTGTIGQPIRYSAKGRSNKAVKTVSIHWAKSDSNLAQDSSWTKIGQNILPCWVYDLAGKDCGAGGTFTPTEAGKYFVTVVVVGDVGPCSGNRNYNVVPGWQACGPKDAIELIVTAPTPPPPPTPSGNISVTPNPCNIPAGSTTCDSAVTYTFSNVDSSRGVALCKENEAVSQMDSGTSATYNARLSAGSYPFKLVTPKWDCTYGTILDSKTVVVNPAPIAPPTPTPVPSKRVFITRNAYTGNLGGLAGADAKCQASANSATPTDLGGRWKAWLSDDTTSAASRLEHSTVPYKLLNGTTIADNWTDLTDGTIKEPINIDEAGSPKSGNSWTGSSVNGTIPTPTTGTTYSCSNWSSQSRTVSGLTGLSPSTNDFWSTSARYPCSYIENLYCFEQSSTPTATSTPTPTPTASPTPTSCTKLIGPQTCSVWTQAVPTASTIYINCSDIPDSSFRSELPIDCTGVNDNRRWAVPVYYSQPSGGTPASLNPKDYGGGNQSNTIWQSSHTDCGPNCMRQVSVQLHNPTASPTPTPTPTSTPTPTPAPTPTSTPTPASAWVVCTLTSATSCSQFCQSQGKTCTNSCTAFGACGSGVNKGINYIDTQYDVCNASGSCDVSLASSTCGTPTGVKCCCQ